MQIADQNRACINGGRLSSANAVNLRLVVPSVWDTDTLLQKMCCLINRVPRATALESRKTTRRYHMACKHSEAWYNQYEGER